MKGSAREALIIGTTMMEAEALVDDDIFVYMGSKCPMVSDGLEFIDPSKLFKQAHSVVAGN